MITKADWDSVHAALDAEARATLGSPPTEEELDAYFEGRLTGDEEARVRKLLVAHPELAMMRFEPDAPQPGDADYVAPEEVERRYQRLLTHVAAPAADVAAVAHIRPPRTSRDGWRMATYALAASLLLVVGGFLAFVRSVGKRGAATPVATVVDGGELFFPSGQRGPEEEPRMLEGNGDEIVVPLAVIAPGRYQQNRLQLSEVQSGEVLWRSGIVRPTAQGQLNVMIRRALLTPGATYRLELFGIDASGEQPVATYKFAVPRP